MESPHRITIKLDLSVCKYKTTHINKQNQGGNTHFKAYIQYQVYGYVLLESDCNLELCIFTLPTARFAFPEGYCCEEALEGLPLPGLFVGAPHAYGKSTNRLSLKLKVLIRS